MEICRPDKKLAVDTSVPLGNLRPKDIFRFKETSYDVALADGTFYMVTTEPPKDERVSLICLSDGQLLRRDKDRRVVTHQTQLSVTE